METIVAIFNHPFFSIVGGISTVFSIIIVVSTFLGIIRGTIPVLYRIGNSITNRKIAIFGDVQSSAILRECVEDTGLFKGNVVPVTLHNIDKLKTFNTILLDWNSCSGIIEKFFTIRKGNASIIIYAQPGSIPNVQMSSIANMPNTVVVNFKGRLLNDILISMITTSFDYK